ncbi:MAG: hypothetical protein Q8S21_04660 [Candidatus Paracaedibacteraceae bacterium]|nr:hypothetical protein [Candidatus Paracaedibacteraceae bacterium]
MKKINYFYKSIFFHAAISFFLLFPAPANATFTVPALSELGEKSWVENKIKEYPELEWLLSDAVQHTQEGKSEQYKYEHSWSKKLKGKHYPEFERTILSIVSLHLIVNGSDQAYKRFTSLQPQKDKLSLVSFKRLHEFANSIIENDLHFLQTLEVNLILGDMGKTQTARLKAKKYGIIESDHDIFLDACLKKCPGIFPTFLSISDKAKKILKKVNGLVHFGHVTHVEGGPEILTKLKQSGTLDKDLKEFDFEILTHICDVSGARGHEDNSGSKVLTENTFKSIESVKEAIHFLKEHSEKEAMEHYIHARANLLGLDKNKQIYILARIGSMLRLFSKEEGKALKDAYASLSFDQKMLLQEELDPLTYRTERTPTYVPALLVNLSSTLEKQGLTRYQAIQECITKGSVFIAQVLRAYRTGKTNVPYNPQLTLNFNKAAGQVRDNPALLNNISFKIDSDLNVIIIK